jgi:glutamate dehydrogenase
MDPEELIQTVRSFALSYRRGAIKVVAASSLAVRGLTLLIIMPREFYTSENMTRIETYLCRYFKSPSATSRIIHFSSDYLSLHVHVNPQAEEIDLDPEQLEQGLTNIARPWEIKLQLQLERAYGEKGAAELWHKYGGAFSREYRTFIHPRFALQDIKRLEKVLATGEEVLDLWGPFKSEEPFYRLQFYSLRQSYLNELMPLLENLNLCVIDEIDFALKIADKEVFIKSFAVRSTAAGARKLSPLRGILLDALAALRNGEAENDYLNRLLVLTGLSWKEIDIFRGYRNYYFQLGSHFTKRRVAFALINNPQVAGLLFRYFEARFRPEPKWETFLQREEEFLSPVRQELVTALQAVTDINEDRILRTLFNLIDSTVRTNFFLRKNRADYFFSFKISAIGIIDMPVPRPLFETYVHCSTMEGIHLRGGAVARGGIRWSDRPDDFRTEILGLMKTQMTKNAVIVPVGSKGGFVVKTPYVERDQGAILAKEAYKTLMRGMLDLTDNRIADKVVRPQGVVAHDDDDPYLVVAADKGTAHLSDAANAISKEYNFWLGDAFASGGSQGYDHKKLGITARGAWECVKRHFREMDIDIQTRSFTVVGIGDMSGDVFGNGMLLSPQIRLLAAFDHRHIFFDPDPDPAASFKERQRLFALPRSSWDGYDRSLISKGGGVFSRAFKEIPLSPEVRSWLGTRHESMDGPSLIRLILSAEVDLLWNGGIGTYVKASAERNEEVGDRANDTVRIDASQLKARVVGEGGNLGFTQKARIEYALAGGRINTDAVDNSAGVDCSDHEVNLKILMRHLREKEVLSSPAERDRLLQEVTDDVCCKVLADNYNQSLCLSLDLKRCAEDVEPFLELAERLTGGGLLDRSGESLPSAKEVLARKNGKFTRPELAILMAYSKMQLFQNLLESDLPERKGVRNFLTCYFPEAIRERFAEHLTDHPLAREITATVLTNTVVNQAGSAFIDQLVRKTGALPAEIMATYLAFNEILDGENLRGQLQALDNPIPSKQQYLFLHRLEDALGVLCIWALEHEMKIQPEEQAIVSYREMVLTFVKILGGILPEMEWEKCKSCAASLEEKGLSPDLARRFSTLSYMEDFLPLVTLVSKTGGDLYSVARTFNEVRNYLGLKEILQLLDAVQVRDRWDRMTYQALKGGFASAAFNLTLVILQESEGNLEAFFAGRRKKVDFYKGLEESLRRISPANYHPFAVLVRVLEGLLP